LGVIYTRSVHSDIEETEILQVKDIQTSYDSPNKKVGLRKVTTVANLQSITSVIRDFDFFVAEKWKISSDGQGSGNTANIGSITDIEDLKNGNGVFSKLGEDWFDEYWMNYGTATMIKGGKSYKITNLKDFLEFKGRHDLMERIVVKATKSSKKK
jgi:hypothetical protein